MYKNLITAQINFLYNSARKTAEREANRKRIEVKYIDTGTSAMNEDGEFKCQHINLEIQEPCCSVADSSGQIQCGCGGERSYFCHDCRNKELDDESLDRRLAEE